MIRAKRTKKTKWHTNREANIYIYYLQWNNNKKKKCNKQETDYNKILVGARTRDRKKDLRRNDYQFETERFEFDFLFFLNLIS
jgi:hypothetical protein